MGSGTLLQGRYRVIRLLGTGAFGRVYLAEDTQGPTMAAVAIKELLDTQSATPEEKREAIAWFKREVGILLALDHAAIPTIHGYWTDQLVAGPSYLVMDYIPGKTLMDYIPGKTLDEMLQEAGDPLPWPRVVSWGIALCDVLGYLHNQTPPVVFRDMKLPNVMLDSRTDSPVLIDFGITRQLTQATGTAIGTWGYVPLEQVLGNAEPRSDLYALGATLHALLTVRRPDAEYARLQRSGLNVEATMRALFPAADTLTPDVPPALAAVLTCATAFSAADRYADAAAMGDALRQVEGQLAASPNAPSKATAHAPAGSSGAITSTHAGHGPSPSPQRGSSRLVVALDGSGDTRSLEEAVRLAPPGASIFLTAGTHRLLQALQIDKPLTLMGAGRDVTHVVCNGAEAVFMWRVMTVSPVKT